MSTKRAVIILANIVPALILLVLGWQRRWVTDDAFINFRIVRNLIDGNGFVYNLGERVEAGTSVLWIGLLAIAKIVPNPFSIEMTSVFLGLSFSVGAVLLAQYAAFVSRPAWQGSVVAPVGALLFVCTMPVWDFATSGLETGLAFFWLAMSWWLLVSAAQSPGRSRILAAGSVISLATLIRPDFGIFQLAFGAALLNVARGTTRRLLFLSAAALVAIPVMFEFFRAGYFASLVPNTALAKSASDTRFEVGLIYLSDFVKPYLLWLPAAALLGAIALRRRMGAQGPNSNMVIVQIAPLVGAALHVVYFVSIGGDYMHARLLLPAFFAALLPVMVIPVKGRSLAIVVATCVWAFGIALFARPSYSIINSDGVIAIERNAWIKNIRDAGGSSSKNPVYLSDYSALTQASQELATPKAAGKVFVRPGDRAPALFGAGNSQQVIYAVTTLGAVGYSLPSTVRVVDRIGLADPIAARLPRISDARPGHSKYLSDDWVAGRFVANPSTSQAKDAAVAVQCGRIDELTQATSNKLTLSRFVNNIKNSLTLTRLKIPSNPSDALAECK